MTDFQNGWLYEAGIGENRAMLIGQGELIRARVERHRRAAKAGAVVDAKFTRQWVAGKSGIVTLESGQECLIQPLPKGLTEGAPLRIEITREALSERNGQTKRTKAKPAADDAELQEGESLLKRIEVSGQELHQAQAHEDDLFAQYGWYDVIEQAETGRVEFDGGALLISVTPAMTVIDVDGLLAPLELAKRAAKEVALALKRLDIAGNIGVDFPTLESKVERGEVGTIFDEHMAGDCERTAINGFGFMQIVSRKTGPSLLEIVQADKLMTAAFDLLRQAERDRGAGAIRLEVHPGVAAKLNYRPHLLEELSKRTGREVQVDAGGDISINGGQISTG